MQADNPQTGQQAQQPKPQVTKMEHPALPANATMIERLALPFVFSLVQSVIKNPQHADELREYLTVLRDSLNAAYPEE